MEHPKIDRVHVYKDDSGEWRATAYSTNDKPIFVSSEGYENHQDARGAAEGAFPDARIDDDNETSMRETFEEAGFETPEQNDAEESDVPHSAPGMGYGEAIPARPSEDQTAEPGSDSENEEGT